MTEASGTQSSVASTGAPDVRLLASEPLDAAAFPARAASPFRVFFEPAAHKEVAQHAGEDTTVEICGVLVGRWMQDEDGPYVHVSASIRGESATNKFA